MTAGAAVFVVFIAVAVYGPATVMVLVGRASLRRSSVAGLVPVEGVVVAYSNWTTPARVTFDYPAPDGTWLRATRIEGMSSIPRPHGWFVTPGDRLTVFVDPARPGDVRLAPSGSAAGLGGTALVASGCAWALLGTLALLVVVTVLVR